MAPLRLAAIGREREMGLRVQWNGGEWQKHCKVLLSMKHGDDIQFVPDRTRGDGGMEAYTLGGGVVYQCYAPEALNVATQTAAIKRKIRTDIKKLIDDCSRTMQILGDEYKIRRWVLLTPEYDDKEVVIYTRTRSRAVRAMQPAPPIWCHSGFEILVTTDKEYLAQELAIYHGPAFGLIQLSIPEPDRGATTDLDAGIAKTLRDKLAVNDQLATDSQSLADLTDATLYDYVYGKYHIDELQGPYSSVYQTVQRRARLTFRSIALRLAKGGFGPSQLEEMINELADGIRTVAPALDIVVCENLARYYVASWLIECPLRFRNAA